MSNKVCHLSTVHKRNDIRIFIKECKTLTSDFQVYYIVADGKGDETRDGVHIIDIGKPKNRLQRMWKFVRKIGDKAISVNADVYHLHDPELLQLTKKLKLNNKKVIFDAHEDLPEQIKSKPYIAPLFGTLISKLIKNYEKRKFSKLDALVAATPYIEIKLKKINPKTYNINNYPILLELYSEDVNWNNKKSEICFVGGVTEIRGVKELVDSLDKLPGESKVLNIVGDYSSEKVKSSIQESKGFEKVTEKGFLDRNGVKQVLRESMAGIVTFLPVPNHINAQPNKMFEYMSASLPVISSDFPLWRDIVTGNDCGICVNPSNEEELSEAINYVLSNPDKAEEMGRNGRKAIEEKYNWEKESVKLKAMYSDVLLNS